MRKGWDIKRKQWLRATGIICINSMVKNDQGMRLKGINQKDADAECMVYALRGFRGRRGLRKMKTLAPTGTRNRWSLFLTRKHLHLTSRVTLTCSMLASWLPCSSRMAWSLSSLIVGITSQRIAPLGQLIL